MSGILLAQSVFAPPAGGGISLPDIGDRADENPLASPRWETVAGGSGVRLLSGVFVASAASTASMSRWIGTAIGNNHRTTTIITANGSDSGGPGVRFLSIGGTPTGYFMTVQGANVYLFKKNTSGYNQLAASAATINVGTTVLSLEITGDALIGKVDGTTLLTATDAELTTGLPGMFCYDGTSSHDSFNAVSL